MKQQIYLVYLDGYHLGDPVFLDDLARAATQVRGQQAPTLFVHGSGEKAERTLEGGGYFVERENGVLAVESAEHIRLVERATREANKEIVEKLTDQQLSVVGIQGVDRNFFTREDSLLRTGSIGWLDDLLRLRVMPIISGLVQEGDYVRETPPAETLLALADRLYSETSDVNIVLLPKKLPKTAIRENGRSSIPLDAVDKSAYPEIDLLTELVKSDHAVGFATPDQLFKKPPQITTVKA